MTEESRKPTETTTSTRVPVLPLRDVVGYRVYRDLRRGWRINAPNLEQCGLIEIDYAELDAVAAERADARGREAGQPGLEVGLRVADLPQPEVRPIGRPRLGLEALRILKRRLSDVVYRALLADTQQLAQAA